MNTHEPLQKYGTNPYEIWQNWLNEAQDNEINDPTAMCLATVGQDGTPMARMVLMKDLCPEKGIKFHTNEESFKGQHIAGNPKVAICMHWKSLRRQIRAEGSVVQVSEAESDLYFKTRPRGRQVGAWASQQSRPFESQKELAQAIAHYEDTFKDVEDIPRPAYWNGYRIQPMRIEFWIGNRDRLHERFEYHLNDGEWIANWLYP